MTPCPDPFQSYGQLGLQLGLRIRARAMDYY